MKMMSIRAFVGVACLATLAISAARPLVARRAALEVIVRRVPNGGLQPQVAVDRAGVMHLLYFAGDPRAGDLFYVRSTDGGETFSPPIRVNRYPGSAIAAGTIRGGQLAIGRGGRVHVGWNGSDVAAPRGIVNPATGRATAPFLYASSDTAAKAFTPERNLMRASYDLDGGGAVTADGAGNVHAVWHANGVADAAGEANRLVWITRSRDDGATFESEQPVMRARTGACGCCGLSALSSGSNRLDILFRSVVDLTNRDVHLLHSNDGGRNFAESMIHEWDINACPMSSMALAATSRGVLGAWESAGQVYFGALGNTSGSAPTAVAAPGHGTNRKHPRLATAANGDTLIVWTEGTAWARGGSLGWQVFDRAGRPVAGKAGTTAGVPAWSFGAVAATRAGGFTVLY
jgi:hypothetical protein